MRIWVKPDTLAKLGPHRHRPGERDRSAERRQPRGQLGGEPAPPGQELTYTVRAQGRLITAEEFGDVVVRANPDGSIVRAEGRRAHRARRADLQAVRALQRQAVRALVAVFQVPGSNALDVADGVKKTMERARRALPGDMEYAVTLDTTLPVTEGIKEIVTTLVEAIGPRDRRRLPLPAELARDAHPAAHGPGLADRHLRRSSRSSASRSTRSRSSALVLAIGLVVDDAIVVVEAVEHHIEHGLSPRDATLKAMDEVTGPVVGIALVLSAVFIPVAFIGGITGRLYQQFALTIAISVLISAFNALTPLARALGAAAPAAAGVPRSARTLLRRVQPRLRAGDARLRRPVARARPQGRRCAS